MPTLSDLGHLPKRLVLGRAVPSDRLGESLLPKRYALPIFASDPLSSVAYATQEILIVLTLAGTAVLYLAPWLAAGVVLLLATVVLSYRQVVHAYPSGGGDYEVAMKNHGQFAALVVASALLVDYVLTVAVSVSRPGSSAGGPSSTTTAASRASWASCTTSPCGWRPRSGSGPRSRRPRRRARRPRPWRKRAASWRSGRRRSSSTGRCPRSLGGTTSGGDPLRPTGRPLTDVTLDTT